MYAVIRTGGKQYRVEKDEVITVERLAGQTGETVELDEVLMLDDGDGPRLGAPLVAGARVAATVLDQGRGEKVLVFKKRRRKNYRRLRGHRQEQTVLRITEIVAAGGRQSAPTEAWAAAGPDEPPALQGAEPMAEDKNEEES